MISLSYHRAPPQRAVEQLDRDARRLVRSELDRVWEFARLSRNGPVVGGPYEAVEAIYSC